MHRVELKVSKVGVYFDYVWIVPNAPCGVERPNTLTLFGTASMFLMHRVELKVAVL